MGLLKFGLFSLFFLFSCGLCFCVCALVRCTPQFGSAYSFNPFLFILISAIDIAPLICHSPSHAQPSHAHCHIHASPTLFLSFFWPVYVSHLVWHKPSHVLRMLSTLSLSMSLTQKVCPLLDCLLTVLTAESRRQNTSGYAHTSGQNRRPRYAYGPSHTGGNRWEWGMEGGI